MLTGIRTLALSAAIALSALIAQPLTTAPAAAQAGEGMTLQELRQRMERLQNLRTEEFRQRLRDFQQRRAEQTQLRDNTQAELTAAEQRATELEDLFEQNERDLAALETQLNERLGAFGELFGVVRQVAADTRGQFQVSMLSAQFPDRGEFLEALAESEDLPEVEQLEGLWEMLVDNAIAQGQAVTFPAQVISTAGERVDANVTRVGPFVAVDDSQFLRWEASNQALVELPAQPPARYTAPISGYLSSNADFAPMALDPSRGTLLSLLVGSPTLLERFQQGGTIGYITAGLAAIGVLLGLWLILRRALENMAISGQRKNPDRPSKGNPLGRVLLAYEANKDADPETLELKLDDAIMRELPRLERGLNTVKVIAAVSPLLGLLGTVTGMILTFQAITLFGTGDPKMMAGGISQALVTTVIGLCGAIPNLLLHSIASGLARSSADTIEGEAAGLVAERAEREGKVNAAA